MARHADGPHGPLLLQFGKLVADPLELRGPFGILHAVDEADVEMVGAELLAEAIDLLLGPARRLDPVGLLRPDLAQQRELVAGQVLDHVLDEGMGAVEIGHVDEADALVEAVPQQAVEGRLALPGVLRGMVVAVEAGALGQAGDLDAGLAQFHDVGAAEMRYGSAARSSRGAAAMRPAPAIEALRKSRRLKEPMVRSSCIRY